MMLIRRQKEEQQQEKAIEDTFFTVQSLTSQSPSTSPSVHDVHVQFTYILELTSYHDTFNKKTPILAKDLLNEDVIGHDLNIDLLDSFEIEVMEAIKRLHHEQNETDEGGNHRSIRKRLLSENDTLSLSWSKVRLSSGPHACEHLNAFDVDCSTHAILPHATGKTPPMARNQDSSDVTSERENEEIENAVLVVPNISTTAHANSCIQMTSQIKLEILYSESDRSYGDFSSEEKFVQSEIQDLIEATMGPFGTSFIDELDNDNVVQISYVEDGLFHLQEMNNEGIVPTKAPTARVPVNSSSETSQTHLSSQDPFTHGATPNGFSEIWIIVPTVFALLILITGLVYRQKKNIRERRWKFPDAAVAAMTQMAQTAVSCSAEIAPTSYFGGNGQSNNNEDIFSNPCLTVSNVSLKKKSIQKSRDEKEVAAKEKDSGFVTPPRLHRLGSVRASQPEYNEQEIVDGHDWTPANTASTKRSSSSSSGEKSSQSPANESDSSFMSSMDLSVKGSMKKKIHACSTDNGILCSPLPTNKNDSKNNHIFHSPVAAAAAAAMSAMPQKGRRKLLGLLRRNYSWPQKRDGKSVLNQEDSVDLQNAKESDQHDYEDDIDETQQNMLPLQCYSSAGKKLNLPPRNVLSLQETQAMMLMPQFPTANQSFDENELNVVAENDQSNIDDALIDPLCSKLTEAMTQIHNAATEKQAVVVDGNSEMMNDVMNNKNLLNCADDDDVSSLSSFQTSSSKSSDTNSSRSSITSSSKASRRVITHVAGAVRMLGSISVSGSSLASSQVDERSDHYFDVSAVNSKMCKDIGSSSEHDLKYQQKRLDLSDASFIDDGGDEASSVISSSTFGTGMSSVNNLLAACNNNTNSTNDEKYEANAVISNYSDDKYFRNKNMALIKLDLAQLIENEDWDAIAALAMDKKTIPVVADISSVSSSTSKQNMKKVSLSRGKSFGSIQSGRSSLENARLTSEQHLGVIDECIVGDIVHAATLENALISENIPSSEENFLVDKNAGDEFSAEEAVQLDSNEAKLQLLQRSCNENHGTEIHASVFDDGSMDSSSLYQSHHSISEIDLNNAVFASSFSNRNAMFSSSSFTDDESDNDSYSSRRSNLSSDSLRQLFRLNGSSSSCSSNSNDMNDNLENIKHNNETGDEDDSSSLKDNLDRAIEDNDWDAVKLYTVNGNGDNGNGNGAATKSNSTLRKKIFGLASHSIENGEDLDDNYVSSQLPSVV